jgi:hypothetical protein
MKTEPNYKEKEGRDQDYQVIRANEVSQEPSATNERNQDTLVFLNERRKKRIDETIDTPDKYLSRFHYDTKNLDKYIDLCPHCRKPTLSTYHSIVIDSALNYLEGKRDLRNRKATLRLCAGVTAGVLFISAGLYVLLSHVFSGMRI